tara:strand:+ start:10578 stop:10781 length:204 start_codon:yes stop_codon:yes gene_type:complete
MTLSESIVLFIFGFYFTAWVFSKIAYRIQCRFDEIEAEKLEKERLDQALANYQRTYRAKQREIKNDK